ncbi:phospholipase D-like domain-containing protein [Cognataquiflexum aquatile]|uniref:phospholipase D-like domain-containing protein n=1 Tax=Cognataquiflexum aquatile TaxID=2249427 RepID=UPI000DEB1DE4|nr:phospholipase D family protein [Cognataquiflexum aquatile]
MKITLLGQGFEKESEFSVGNQLIKFFSSEEYRAFTAISAFTSKAAINGLSQYILKAKTHLENITIITGVDQKGTTKEALEELLSLDILTFVFYQPSITIFHPKIYLFEGDKKSELIIGSSNLTLQGLFTNVEFSLLISLDNTIDSDKEIVKQLKEYFGGIFDYSDPNLQAITPEIIEALVNAKVVPTEIERMATQDKLEIGEKEKRDELLSRIFPKRIISKIPPEFRGSISKFQKMFGKETFNQFEIKSTKSRLLWTSGPLTERDLNIPKGSNTNPTGSMNFKKGKTKEIDQRHYFRDEVFSDLEWEKDSHLERATALFKLIIDDIDFGDFELKITHNPRTDTVSYVQKNSVTSISWGEAKKIIAKEEYIGKNANLFKNTRKGEFTIEIK